MNRLIERLKEEYHKAVRPTGVWTDQFLLVGIIGFVLVSIGQVIGLFLEKPLFAPINLLTNNENATRFLLQYFDFIGIWVLILAIMYFIKKNRPMMGLVVSKKKSNNWKSLLIGLALGLAMNGFCAIMSILLHDIEITFSSFNPVLFFLFLFCVFVQSGAEELVSRGYLYLKLRRRYYNPLLAILWTALYFVLFHLFNPNLSYYALGQIFFVGVLFALFVYYFDDLWMAMACHAGWNFSQSIIFGLPNSGIVSEYSVFKLNLDTMKSGFFYDIGFGIEGSPGGLLVCILAVVVTYLICRNRKEKIDYWAEQEKELLAKGKESV